MHHLLHLFMSYVTFVLISNPETDQQAVRDRGKTSMTVYESWASSSLSLLLLCIDWLSIYTTIHTSSLEKEMATHSSILFFFFLLYFTLQYCIGFAWKIPWMEETGRLQSMGSQSQTRLSAFTSTIPLQLHVFCCSLNFTESLEHPKLRAHFISIFKKIVRLKT